jgi:hypothetical protein
MFNSIYFRFCGNHIIIILHKLVTRNVINLLLADHVLREADHFIYMIHVLEERLNKKKSEQQQ